MARAILSSLASTIHDLLLSSQSPSPPCSGRVLEELRTFEELLVSSALQGVLGKTEERQWLDEQVWNLLTEFMDAAHDAEDAIDELHYELLQSESDDTARHAEPPSTKEKGGEVRNLFASLACRILSIKDRLNQILGEVDSIKFNACQAITCAEHVIFGPDQAEKETEIYGREDDLNNVVDLVLSESPEDACVIAVVGEAGVGKTALLQLLCNDPRIRGHFARRGWVRMTENFDAATLKREMIESMTSRPWRCEFSGKGYWIYADLNYGKSRLEYELKMERFLVVLDDFSDDNLHLWETILHILQIGHVGSKIILVTRSESITKILENMPIYHLKRLSEDSCWELFKHLANNSHKSNQSNLIAFGKKIVQKCNGLPLSVKMLGTLLQCETREERWSAILNHSLWNFDESKHKAFPAAVILSYHYLPPQLQSCVAYCSVFHKSFLFRKDQLVRLWMAQGLIGREKGKTVEEIGVELFDELIRRSFFFFCEKVRRPIVLPSDADEEIYVMHNVIHDLANHMSRKSCSTKDIENIQCIPDEVRHLSLIAMDTRTDVKLELEGESKSLHTMLLLIKSLNSPYKVMWYDEGRLNLSFSPYIFGKFNYLRILLLSYTEITELPDSIGNLKHLRYLALNYTGIRWLPQQLCSLYYLQTLELQACPYLVALPSGIAHLPNLRHVDLVDSSERILLHQGIGRLSGLQTLTLFYVGRKKEHYVIRELGDLVNLRGELHIVGLHHVEDICDAKSANLMNKKYIKKLTLQWCDPNDACDRNGSLSNYADSQCRKCSHDETKSSIITDFSEHGDHAVLTKAETSSSVDNCIQDRRSGEDTNDTTNLNDEVIKKLVAEEIEFTSALQKTTCSDDLLNWFSNFEFDFDPPKPKITMEERIQRMAKARMLQEGALEALRPHVNLKDFVIRFYLGSKFSSWIGDASFCNMASVTLQSCFNCEALPPLGQLPSLRYLFIRDFPKVKYVGREFCGSGTEDFRAFPSLETLQFEEMFSWEEWSGVEDGDFPCLSDLMTWGCSNLKVAPKFVMVSGEGTYFWHEFIGRDISS